MGIITRQQINSHVVDYGMLQSCGVHGGLLWPLIEKECGRAFCNNQTERSDGEITFRFRYEDVSWSLGSIIDRHDFDEAIANLEVEGFLLRLSDQRVTIVDPFRHEAPLKVKGDDLPRHLYVFRDGSGLYKIGITKDLTRRSKELYPAQLVCSAEVADAARLEREFHEQYAAYRREGEWFSLPESLVAKFGQ